MFTMQLRFLITLNIFVSISCFFTLYPHTPTPPLPSSHTPAPSNTSNDSVIDTGLLALGIGAIGFGLGTLTGQLTTSTEISWSQYMDMFKKFFPCVQHINTKAVQKIEELRLKEYQKGSITPEDQKCLEIIFAQSTHCEECKNLSREERVAVYAMVHQALVSWGFINQHGHPVQDKKAFEGYSLKVGKQ